MALAGALLLLAGPGCSSMQQNNQKIVHPHYRKDEVQHMYDTGQINYAEYCQMMKQIDANWTPQSPPPADKPYNMY